MAGSDVKVLGFFSSPFVNRVQFALILKSIDYELIEESKANKSELLLRSNPIHKKVPVLFHGDREPICESLVILHYIEETWPHGPSILPPDPYDRAVARFWAAHIDEKWLQPAMVELMKVRENEEAKVAVLQEIIEGFVLLEDVFIKCSKGKPFFGGDAIGYLDMVLGCFLGWLKLIALVTNVKILDEAKTPCLAIWAERFCSEQAVKDVLPPEEKLFELRKANRAMQAAAADASK